MSRAIKLQSAMEYLLTYGWALLVLAAVLAVIGWLLFSAPTTPQACILSQGLTCQSATISANGMLQLDLLQSTQDPIRITAIGCTTPSSLAYMQGSNPPSNSVNMAVGSNYTFYVQCYSNSAPFSGSIGTGYSGTLIINYTDTYSGFPSTVYGTISEKVA